MSTTPLSFIDRLDPRVKMLLTASTAIATIVFSGLISQLLLWGSTFTYALSTKRYRALGIMYLAMSAVIGVALIFASIIEYVNPNVGGLSLKSLGIPFLRGLTMMNTVLALATTTKVQDLIHALQSLRLPFCIYLPAVVMVRFLPTFASDIRQVWEALKIRGWKLSAGFFCRHPFFAARLLFTPLLFRALKSSEALGVAAELKGLGVQKSMTMLTHHRCQRADYLMLGVAFIVLSLAIYAQIYYPTWGLDDGVGIP